mgnify:CR=1 FL=1|tara:strand:- start:172 stop:1965 length:1794 start_codon:yes stop_codon:yes gene_type:complete
MAKRKTPIDYTSRDFDSIKQSLVDYAKRYYPEVYQDFNDASFGSLMLDLVSYVGDVMSFYVDYQANESFLSTAIERKNVINLSRQMGYKYQQVATASGIISLYVLVPANFFGLGPDMSYAPILRQGSTFSSQNGNNFILIEDVRFDNPANEVVAGRIDESTGVPSFYAIRAKGKIISGNIEETRETIGSYQRFRKIILSDRNIVEILSVEDSDGNEYFQVENLAQNVVYKSFSNKGTDSETVSEFLRPVSVPRRFVFENDGTETYLQFGFGSEDELTAESVANPSSVSLELYGRDYVSDVRLDPSKLLNSDKLGISPSNTQLIIRYRKNSSSNPNASVGSIDNLSNAIIEFPNLTSLEPDKISAVRRSLECTNEQNIVGSSVLSTSEEIKQRAISYFATQGRAVTENDYEALTYAMPSKFGAISRCSVVVDNNSFKRNLNLYVLTEDRDSNLSIASSSLKENLRIWISNYKMINDTIDIIDGKIVNVGINFEVIADPDYNKTDIFNKCLEVLRDKYSQKLIMGEPLYLTEIYFELNRVTGVIDTKNVRLVDRRGAQYSQVEYNIEDNLSPDGRFLACPKNVCLEIKFPNVDITGVVR